MRCRIIHVLILLSGAMIFVSCIFQGGGTDQPNEINGVAFHSDNTLAVHAQVNVFSGSYSPGYNENSIDQLPLLKHTVRVSEDGTFLFRSVEPGAYYLEILSRDSSEIIIENDIFKQPDQPFNAGELVLAPVSSLSGSVNATSDPIDFIAIPGTHHRVFPQVDSSYSFPALSSGEFSLVAAFTGRDTILLLSDSIDLAASQTVILPPVSIVLDSLLLYDFETDDLQNALKGITYHPDSSTHGLWDSENPWVVVSSEAWQGRSAQLDSGDYYIAIGAGGADGYYDFSNMTEFVFYAKGPGSITIGFSSKMVEFGEGSLVAAKTLSGQWERISVTPQEIAPEKGTPSDSLGRTWEEGKTAISRIQLFNSEKSSILIDNIHLRGLRPEDLKK